MIGVHSRIDSFIGPNCAGNGHKVVAGEELDENALAALSEKYVPDILVYIERELSLFSRLDEGLSTSVHFFYRGKRTHFCGSGILAAAAFIHQGFAFGDREIQIHLSSLSMTVDVGLKATDTKIQRFYFRGHIEFSPVQKDTSLWQLLINEEIINAVLLPQGYLIVEIDCSRRLKYLKPNLEKLEEIGGPSLVVTAVGGQEYVEDYVMRYFAPQYGNPEDSATGSANFYLMKYWGDKLGKNTLRARQLSLSGGLFYGELKKNTIQLEGEVQYR